MERPGPREELDHEHSCRPFWVSVHGAVGKCLLGGHDVHYSCNVKHFYGTCPVYNAYLQGIKAQEQGVVETDTGFLTDLEWVDKLKEERHVVRRCDK